MKTITERFNLLLLHLKNSGVKQALEKPEIYWRDVANKLTRNQGDIEKTLKEVFS